jgi:hypothetical protein
VERPVLDLRKPADGTSTTGRDVYVAQNGVVGKPDFPRGAGNHIDAAVIRPIKTILTRFVAQRMAVSAPLMRKGEKSSYDTAI